jgi:CDP-glucose 4,6-dehydratase
MENLQKFFKNKKILITGHTGFKGSWLTQILLKWGANIIGIALKPSTDPSLFYLLDIKKHINNYFADIRNFKKVKEIIFKEKPEIVFHLAAQPLVRDSYDDPLYTFETNIIGTANVLEAVKEVSGVKSAVIITTDKVYEEKKRTSYYNETDKLGGYDPYSSSKTGAEIVINSYIKSFFNPKDYEKSHKTLIASARSGNVIGGGDWQKDRLLPDIIKVVFERKGKLLIRNPNSIRPWQYVLEPLYGYLILVKKLYEGKKNFSEAWNFGSKQGNYLTVRALTEKVFKILEQGAYKVKRDPLKYETLWLGLNINKAKKFLGWQPILNLKETLDLTLSWYKSFYNKESIIPITNKQIEDFFNKIKMINK